MRLPASLLLFLCAASSVAALPHDVKNRATPRWAAAAPSPSDKILTGEMGDGDASSSTGSGAAYNNAEGGSGGDSGSFNLSQGGLIAIIVVVVVVVIFGIASAVLFFVAKKRQWEVRASIRRMSRRFTGGGKSASRQSKRGAVRMQSPTRNTTNKDAEKGPNKKEPKPTEAETKAQNRVQAIVPDTWSVGRQGRGKEGSH